MSKTDNNPLTTSEVLEGAKHLPVWHRHFLVQPYRDWVAQEVPVALVYNGISHVVMMASPKDLEDFALGFSLSENIITSASDIYGIDVAAGRKGYEVNIELSSRRLMALKTRRRTLAGRTGCGICGAEQLTQINRPITPLPFTQTFDLACLRQGLAVLRDQQPVGQSTGCTHVAAWLTSQGRLIAGIEDIGRHVALDKLLGQRARSQEQTHWQQGAILISSRASYEIVQKAAQCGVEILFALSAATTLAVEVAERCNVTLVGFCRPDSGTIYTHPQRLLDSSLP